MTAGDWVDEVLQYSQQIRDLDEQRERVAARRREAMRRALDTMTRPELAEQMHLPVAHVSRILQGGD